MIEILRQTPPTTVVADTVALLRDTGAYVMRGALQALTQARGARALEMLDDAQLRDVGLTRVVGPTLEVEAATMARLMSLR